MAPTPVRATCAAEVASARTLPEDTRRQIDAQRLMLESMDRKARLYGGPVGAIHLLDAASVRFQSTAEDLAAIPRVGPILVTASHSCGVEEALLLAALLPEARPDIKIVANHLIAGIPELTSRFIPVDPWETRRAAAANRTALAGALNWLLGGHLLAVFPTGDRIPGPGPAMWGGAWSSMIPRLVRRSGAAIVPVYFCIAHLDGSDSSGLRSFIEVRIGRAIPSEAVTAIAGDEDAANYLRWKTLSLRSRHDAPVRLVPRPADGNAARWGLMPAAMLE